MVAINYSNMSLCKIECDKWGYIDILEFDNIQYTSLTEITQMFSEFSYTRTRKAEKKEVNPFTKKPFVTYLQTYKKQKGQYTYIAEVEYVSDKLSNGEDSLLASFKFTTTTDFDAEWNKILQKQAEEEREREEKRMAKIRHTEQLRYDSVMAGLTTLTGKPTKKAKLTIDCKGETVETILSTYAKHPSWGENHTMYNGSRYNPEKIHYITIDEPFNVYVDKEGKCKVENKHGFAELLTVTADGPAQYYFEHIDKYAPFESYKTTATLRESVGLESSSPKNITIKYNKKANLWKIITFDKCVHYGWFASPPDW